MVLKNSKGLGTGTDQMGTDDKDSAVSSITDACGTSKKADGGQLGLLRGRVEKYLWLQPAVQWLALHALVLSGVHTCPAYASVPYFLL